MLFNVVSNHGRAKTCHFMWLWYDCGIILFCFYCRKYNFDVYNFLFNVLAFSFQYIAVKIVLLLSILYNLNGCNVIVSLIRRTVTVDIFYCYCLGKTFFFHMKYMTHDCHINARGVGKIDLLRKPRKNNGQAIFFVVNRA